MSGLRTIGRAAAVLALLLGAPATTEAQTRVAAERDWSVFESGTGAQKVCWIVSTPTQTRATRGGQTVQVRRGDIFLMVAVRPGEGVTGEVSYIAGYPFQAGSKVEAKVGPKAFSLFTDGENAWAPSARDDSEIVSAFRAGSSVQVRGVSGRGTQTSDTFSLAGFTAALDRATSRCN